MITKKCPKCEHIVTEDGYYKGTKGFLGKSYDWFNRGLPKDIGPCRGCHEMDVQAIFMVIDMLVKLKVLR